MMRRETSIVSAMSGEVNLRDADGCNTVGKFVKWLVMDRVNRIGGMALEYGQKPGRKPKPVPERIGPMRKKR